MRRKWERRRPTLKDEASIEYAKAMFQKVEKWLDAGFGACWFRRPEYAQELQRCILHFHNQRYEIGCFVIMANHCHLVIRPFVPSELATEVGDIKRITARFINKREGGAGELWQQESYDRIIRDEEHLYRVVQYIGANPRRAGIPTRRWDRWMNPEWKACGWDFQDS